MQDIFNYDLVLLFVEHIAKGEGNVANNKLLRKFLEVFNLKKKCLKVF